MITKIFHLGMILLIALFPINLSATSKPKITISWTTEVWPLVAEEDGTGAYFDLLNAVFAVSEFELIHRFLPYKRGELYVKKGEMDIFSMCAPMVDFQRPKHAWAQDTLGVLFDPDVITHWQGADSLADKNIALHKELEVLPFVQNINAHLLKTENKSKSLQLLEKRRADFFLDIFINIQDELKQHKEISSSHYIFQPLQVITCTPGFTDSDKGKKLSQIWDDGIKRLYYTGKLQAIFNKWHLQYPDYLIEPF